MTVHVGLVRAVMQGREGLTGDVLRGIVEDAGGSDVRTFHATGNVLFRATDGAAVCEDVSAAITALLGRPTPVLHRTATHLTAIAEAGFFADAPEGAERIIVFVDAELDAEVVRSAMPGDTRVVGRVDRDVACVRPAARGSHPMPAIEALTDAPVTARSIRTVAGIARAAAHG